jgi:acetyl/propionyl-CoA carboxylase alpha subunit
MTFEIDLNGSRRTVSVEPAGTGRYRVMVDGKAHDVLAERTGDFGLSLIVAGDQGSGERSADVVVAPGATGGELLVGLRGRTVAVTVNGRKRARASDVAGHTHGEQAVKATMPGRVVRVLVGAGDAVAVRQPVVVVEAMKMENELRSPKAGKVREVTVTPGTSVDAGRVLVVIE